MSRFGSNPIAFFNAVYGQTPPWDIGGPQPAMAALLEKYPPTDPILDVGCGSGDLAIYLARLGHEALGIDFVEVAIQQAKEKTRLLPADVARLLDFEVADALKPSRLQRQFGSIVDSGFFHLFDAAQCELYIDELALALHPGGKYYLHAFAIDFSIPNVPRQVTERELRSSFTSEKGWNILDIQSAEFLSSRCTSGTRDQCLHRAANSKTNRITYGNRKIQRIVKSSYGSSARSCQGQ